MTKLDTAICRSCRRSTTVCRLSFLGALASSVTRDMQVLAYAEADTLRETIVCAAEQAAYGWDTLIEALTWMEHMTVQEAYGKAALMVEEAGR